MMIVMMIDTLHYCSKYFVLCTWYHTALHNSFDVGFFIIKYTYKNNNYNNYYNNNRSPRSPRSSSVSEHCGQNILPVLPQKLSHKTN